MRSYAKPGSAAGMDLSPEFYELLKKLLVLQDTECSELARLCKAGVYCIGPGTTIADEGDRQLYNYLVLDGWACRCRFVDSTRRQITGLLLPGEFSNLDLDANLRSDHVMCSLTSLTYASVDTEQLLAAVTRAPGLARALRVQQRHEQSIQRESAVSLGRRSARERVAHLLCELQSRFNCTNVTQNLTIDMPLLQADLADVVGLTPIHVNRMLQQLRALELIRSDVNRVVIIDLDGLRRLACFDETYLRLAGYRL